MSVTPGGQSAGDPPRFFMDINLAQVATNGSRIPRLGHSLRSIASVRADELLTLKAEVEEERKYLAQHAEQLRKLLLELNRKLPPREEAGGDFKRKKQKVRAKRRKIRRLDGSESLESSNSHPLTTHREEVNLSASASFWRYIKEAEFFKPVTPQEAVSSLTLHRGDLAISSDESTTDEDDTDIPADRSMKDINVEKLLMHRLAGGVLRKNADPEKIKLLQSSAEIRAENGSPGDTKENAVQTNTLSKVNMLRIDDERAVSEIEVGLPLRKRLFVELRSIGLLDKSDQEVQMCISKPQDYPLAVEIRRMKKEIKSHNSRASQSLRDLRHIVLTSNEMYAEKTEQAAGDLQRRYRRNVLKKPK